MGLSCRERGGPSFCVSFVAWQPIARLRAPLFLYMCSILRHDCGEQYSCEYMPKISVSCFRLALNFYNPSEGATSSPRILDIVAQGSFGVRSIDDF